MVAQAASALDGLIQLVDARATPRPPDSEILAGLRGGAEVLGQALLNAGVEWPPYLATAMKGLNEATDSQSAATAFCLPFTIEETPALKAIGLEFVAERAGMISGWRIFVYNLLKGPLGEQDASAIVGRIHPWLAGLTMEELEGRTSAADSWQILRDWCAACPSDCPPEVRTLL